MSDSRVVIEARNRVCQGCGGVGGAHTHLGCWKLAEEFRARQAGRTARRATAPRGKDSR